MQRQQAQECPPSPVIPGSAQSHLRNLGKNSRLVRQAPSQTGSQACRRQYTILPTDVPPQTKSVCPVTNDAFGSAKKVTARATSCGVPKRPTGTCLAAAVILALPAGIISSNISVSAIGPGAMTFTVIPSAASSSAQVRASPSMPALVAEYAVRLASPSAAREEINTMRPKRARRTAYSATKAG